MASPPPRGSRPHRPSDEPPGLPERIGCFVFVALPLVFGLPIATAWGAVVGSWFLTAYVIGSLILLLFIVYLLEREEPER